MPQCPGRSRSSPTRRRYLPPSWPRSAGIAVVPAAGRDRRDGRTTRARDVAPAAGRGGAAGVQAGQHLAARAGARSLEVYEEAAAAGRERRSSRCTCPREMSGTYESAQLAAARRAGAGRTSSTRGSVGDGHRLRGPSPRRGVDAGGATPRRRRAPRATAPRPPRRCSTSTRWSTCAAAAGSARPRRCSGSALAVKPLLADRRRPDRARWRRCARRRARWPGWRSSPCEAAGRPASTSPCPTSPRRRGPATSPTGSRAAIPGSPTCVVGEVGAVIGAHVGPGMLAVVVAPR